MIYTFGIALLVASCSAFPGLAGTRRSDTALDVLPRAAPAAAAASPSGFPAWKPAQAGEVRSPCPGLNALANHDICPRSGKGYTIPILIDCLKRGMNMGEDFSIFVGTAGIGSNPAPNLLNPSFDLDMLRRHNVVIEHDASLSRGDASTGNNYSFNQTIWNTVLAYFGNAQNATIPPAAKAKYNRVTTEYKRDPNFSYGPVQFIFSYGETAIYLSTMGDPTTGSAPLSYVRSLFEQERLPYELGWRPTVQPTTLASLAAMVFELNKANGEEIPEGMIVAEKTLKAILIGLDPTTGRVVNPKLNALAQLTGAVL